MKCRNCKKDASMLCLCGFCPDCIEKFGHQQLSEQCRGNDSIEDLNERGKGEEINGKHKT